MRYLFLILLFIGALVPACAPEAAHAATAKSQNAPPPLAGQSSVAPKPLIADTPGSSGTSSTSKSKKDPNALPEELADMQQKAKDEFNAWMKYSQEVEKFCSEARTPVDRSSCEGKRRIAQKKREDVNRITQDFLRGRDVWRNKKAGLPPPSWWYPQGQTNAPASGNSYSGSAPQQPPQPSVLLPSSDTPLPAGTF